MILWVLVFPHLIVNKDWMHMLTFNSLSNIVDVIFNLFLFFVLRLLYFAPMNSSWLVKFIHFDMDWFVRNVRHAVMILDTEVNLCFMPNAFYIFKKRALQTTTTTQRQWLKKEINSSLDFLPIILLNGRELIETEWKVLKTNIEKYISEMCFILDIYFYIWLQSNRASPVMNITTPLRVIRCVMTTAPLSAVTNFNT